MLQSRVHEFLIDCRLKFRRKRGKQNRIFPSSLKKKKKIETQKRFNDLEDSERGTLTCT